MGRKGQINLKYHKSECTLPGNMKGNHGNENKWNKRN